MPPPPASRLALHAELIAVVCLFCLPLFLGLKNADLENDEAIYSYAVDRMLETGDWLTAREIPSDDRFLEKPPLKFWLVAGAIRLGVLPHDEFGLRFFDALFGALGFLYTFVLGRRLGGAWCGAVATLVLFTFQPLVFEHGLRSNNMEAPLFLAYCGGMYHFARWVEREPGRRRKLHALAVGAYFALGFMTKFVAVLFLPLVCAAAFAWRGDALRRLRTSGSDWTGALILVIALIAPWFIYQTATAGGAVWRDMFVVHVYERFTAALDPRHLEPWHFYVAWTWSEFSRAGSQWLVLLGGMAVAAGAWLGRPWLARLVLLWWLLPIALLSIGTSKLFHYAYPFVPALALGAGLAAVILFHAAEHLIARMARPVSDWFARKRLARLPGPPRATAQWWCVGVGFAALAIALWTATIEPIRWTIGDVVIFRNTSVTRPLLAAAVFLSLGGHTRRVTAAVIVAAILPLGAYRPQLDRLTTPASPLQAVRDCAASVPQSQRETYLHAPYERLLNHSFYYYLRQIGPWIDSRPSPDDELRRRLLSAGEQTLVIITRGDYESFRRQVGTRAPGIALSTDLLLLTPGPFERCGGAALSAGGTVIGPPRPTGSRP